jgi:glycosyltransferase involved in cell wall biosynthesis
MAGDAGAVHFFRWAGFAQQAGFSVDVLSYERPGKMDPTLNYAGYRMLRRAPTRLSKVLSIVLDVLRVNHPAYVLANFHYLSPRWAAYVLARHGPSMITCWGSDILVHYRRARGPLKALLRAALRKAVAITCDSEDIRRIVVEATGRPEKVHLVYWGVDLRRFFVTPDSRNLARRHYRIPPDAIVILSIRRAVPNFQLEQLIEWFATSMRDPRVILFIHAVPTYDPEYASRCIQRASGIPNVILNTKKLTTEEMRELYALSDIDIHNPVSDGTPVSILEGIACGNLMLCSEAIEAYRNLARQYAIAFFRSLEEVTVERIRMMQGRKDRVVEKNAEVLKRTHSDARTVEALAVILRSLMEGRPLEKR